MDSLQNNTENTQLAEVSDVNFQELIAKSQELANLNPIINLSAEYIELEKAGESFRGVYAGMQDMNVTDTQTGEQRKTKAVRFMIDKQIRINGGVVLVSEIERSGIDVGTPVEVTYTGKKGNLKIYSVTLLG